MEKSSFVYETLCEIAHKFFTNNKKAYFNNVLLVGMQHILGTTVDMLQAMRYLGLTQAVIGGKKYSTHAESAKKIQQMGFDYVQNGTQLGYGQYEDCIQEVVQRMWALVLNKVKTQQFDLIIVLDDGANLLRATPGLFFDGAGEGFPAVYKPKMIIGIEQTRGGTNHPSFNGFPFPIINVAGSFVKARLEYPKVAELIAIRVVLLLDKLVARDAQRQWVIGVSGCGVMGQSIIRCLVSRGFSIIVYDTDYLQQRSHVQSVTRYEHAAVMLSNADIIIGCTGRDITADPESLSALLYSRQDKWLISTGSKDVEFNRLLRVVQENTRKRGRIPDPLKTIVFKNKMGGVLEIIRGGFPVNFSNEVHSVAPEHIWPTRAALMLACLLAASYKQDPAHESWLQNSEVLMLPVDIQMIILNKYFEINPFSNTLSDLYPLSKHELETLVKDNSEGIIPKLLPEVILGAS